MNDKLLQLKLKLLEGQLRELRKSLEQREKAREYGGEHLADLRGIWKKYGPITAEDIETILYRLSEEEES
jgi:hypothetical protein